MVFETETLSGAISAVLHQIDASSLQNVSKLLYLPTLQKAKCHPMLRVVIETCLAHLSNQATSEADKLACLDVCQAFYQMNANREHENASLMIRTLGNIANTLSNANSSSAEPLQSMCLKLTQTVILQASISECLIQGLYQPTCLPLLAQLVSSITAVICQPGSLTIRTLAIRALSAILQTHHEDCRCQTTNKMCQHKVLLAHVGQSLSTFTPGIIHPLVLTITADSVKTHHALVAMSTHALGSFLLCILSDDSIYKEDGGPIVWSTLVSGTAEPVRPLLTKLNDDWKAATLVRLAPIFPRLACLGDISKRRPSERRAGVVMATKLLERCQKCFENQNTESEMAVASKIKLILVDLLVNASVEEASSQNGQGSKPNDTNDWQTANSRVRSDAKTALASLSPDSVAEVASHQANLLVQRFLSGRFAGLIESDRRLSHLRLLVGYLAILPCHDFTDWIAESCSPEFNADNASLMRGLSVCLQVSGVRGEAEGCPHGGTLVDFLEFRHLDTPELRTEGMTFGKMIGEAADPVLCLSHCSRSLEHMPRSSNQLATQLFVMTCLVDGMIRKNEKRRETNGGGVQVKCDEAMPRMEDDGDDDNLETELADSLVNKAVEFVHSSSLPVSCSALGLIAASFRLTASALRPNSAAQPSEVFAPLLRVILFPILSLCNATSPDLSTAAAISCLDVVASVAMDTSSSGVLVPNATALVTANLDYVVNGVMTHFGRSDQSQACFILSSLFWQSFGRRENLARLEPCVMKLCESTAHGFSMAKAQCLVSVAEALASQQCWSFDHRDPDIFDDEANNDEHFPIQLKLADKILSYFSDYINSESPSLVCLGARGLDACLRVLTQSSKLAMPKVHQVWRLVHPHLTRLPQNFTSPSPHDIEMMALLDTMSKATPDFVSGRMLTLLPSLVDCMIEGPQTKPPLLIGSQTWRLQKQLLTVVPAVLMRIRISKETRHTDWFDKLVKIITAWREAKQNQALCQSWNVQLVHCVNDEIASFFSL